jgi:DHA1 family inner membrane transport protein
LVSLYVAGPSTVAAVALEALAGFGLGAFAISNQNRVLIVAPGNTDVANAWAAASFNIGIGGGALVGSGALAALGARSTALVGGLLAGAALVVLIAEHLLYARPGAARP